MMAPRWDLIVQDQKDRPVLAVEIKRKIDASPEWAAQLRHDMLAHGIIPDTPYLLMVFPDRFYLWKSGGSIQDETKPTLSIDARPILGPYFDRAGVLPDQISRASLEIIIAAWLNTVLLRTADELDASERWLIDSGVYDALVGGKIEYEVMA